MASSIIKVNVKSQEYRNDRFKDHWMKFAGKVYCDRNSFRRLFNSKNFPGFFTTSSSDEVLNFIMNDIDYNNEKIIFYYLKDFSFDSINKKFIGKHRSICADKMMYIGITEDSNISVFISDYSKPRAFKVWSL